jgi:tellurite resistance protein TerC
MTSIGTPTLWLGFTAIVVLLLILDLKVFHRKAHEVHVKEALAWSAVWIMLAVMFGASIYVWSGSRPGLEFFTGYLIEKALSVDNLFVFLVIFSYFKVPAEFQHRVLFWGILGAMVMRAIFIFAGAALISQFHWLLYVFGGFLLLTGIKLLRHSEIEVHPERNPLFRWFQRVIPTVSEYRGARFTVVENGVRFATPLLLVLVAVEASDILFAVDSVPAIFGVTTDPFIAYTSNICAILGLRALYFVLADAMSRFQQLKVGLALVLVFIGLKMLVSGVFHVPIGISLAIVVLLLVGSVVASVLLHRPPETNVKPGRAT